MIAMSYGKTAFAEPVTGTANVKLNYVFAILKTGEADPKPEDTAVCKGQVSTLGSRYLGLLVTTVYSIDTKSTKMGAVSSMQSPYGTHHTLKIPLHALAADGGPGEYAFGATHPSALPRDNVFFSIIEPGSKAAISSVTVFNNNKDYNCLVTSDPKPFNNELSAKYRVDQQ